MAGQAGRKGQPRDCRTRSPGESATSLPRRSARRISELKDATKQGPSSTCRPRKAEAEPEPLHHHGRDPILLLIAASTCGSRRCSTIRKKQDAGHSAASGSLATTSRRRTASRSPSANSGRTPSTAGRRPRRPDRERAASAPAPESRGSLLPSIVLEVLKILEGEVNLQGKRPCVVGAGPSRPQGGRPQEAGRRPLRDPAYGLVRPGSRSCQRANPRDLPDGDQEFGRRIQPAGQGERGHGRGDRDPREARHRPSRDRRGDRGHRAIAPVPPD